MSKELSYIVDGIFYCSPVELQLFKDNSITAFFGKLFSIYSNLKLSN